MKLNNLSQYFSLNNKVSIYIPSTIDVDVTIDNSKYVNDITKKFCLMFGGATAQEVVGSWYSDDLKKVVTENVTIVYSNCSDDQLKDNINEVENIAKKLCKDMTQECISLEVNGVLYFVD